MVHPKIERTMADLKGWCRKKRGRQAELARFLGYGNQLVTDWFNGKAIPTWDTGERIRDFLKEQKGIYGNRIVRKDKP